MFVFFLLDYTWKCVLNDVRIHEIATSWEITKHDLLTYGCYLEKYL